MNKNAAYWIEKLGLSPHPEGGYFIQTYRSDESVRDGQLPRRFEGDRVFSTAIYYLLEGKQFSAFHRIKSDEIWHFYTGSSLTLYVIDGEGRLSRKKLGNAWENGEAFQVVVKAGCWFAASVNDPDSYALVGCTVAPGFEYEDFELAERKRLIKEYPQHQRIIERLTK
ncbi:cupin domain-containing protein [Desulforhabdus amnigena]|uniref:DUF985 domain-containing protein n=1 Tax=Desulforhabdus amnigena TaxID=40218 RepID=A0A9W6L985_9BACT|nr:cupin domain-containing protein [Desulforhabdus amnigena]GLI35369.1 hypothetical protein DAMNIGENAA_28020 [Desulforhabdus amnigena]